MKGRRLQIFADQFSKDCFLFVFEKKVFARSCKIDGKWVVWFTQNHSQFSFSTLKETISAVNEKFIRWITGT